MITSRLVLFLLGSSQLTLQIFLLQSQKNQAKDGFGEDDVEGSVG